MKKVYPLLITLALATLLFAGCQTVAQSQFYRPANYDGAPYKIGGEFNTARGLAGHVTISINDEVIIEKNMPLFTNSTEVEGIYGNKPVTVVLTRINNFVSTYIRADVMIENERAASLTF